MSCPLSTHVLCVFFIFSSTDLLYRYTEEPQADRSVNPIHWWYKRKDEYPYLWHMARDLLSIPATSAPSERTFSRAGHIYTKHRKCLHADAAQALLNLGSWWGVEGLPGINVPTFEHPALHSVPKTGHSLPFFEIDDKDNFKILHDEVGLYDGPFEGTAADKEELKDIGLENQIVDANVGGDEVEVPMPEESD